MTEKFPYSKCQTIVEKQSSNVSTGIQQNIVNHIKNNETWQKKEAVSTRMWNLSFIFR